MTTTEIQQQALAAAMDLKNQDLGPVNALLDDDAFWVAQEARIKQAEEQEQREKDAERQERQRQRIAEIPAIYRTEFDPKLSSLDRETILLAREWSPERGKGLGLIGTTGLGKTRLLVRVLMRLQNCSWLYMPAAKFAKNVRAQYDEDWGVSNPAFTALRYAHRVRVLLLDDIGQESPTEAVSEALFELVEDRTSRSLPILWTCNLSGPQLAQRHKTRGAALVRRLIEFSDMPKS